MKVDHFSFIPESGLGLRQENSVHEREIIDVYSNLSLLNSQYRGDWDPSTRELSYPVIGIQPEDFESQAKNLMSDFHMRCWAMSELDFKRIPTAKTKATSGFEALAVLPR
jgi:hypothetical protein